MDIGLLRQRCVEIDPKDFFNPDESGYEDWARDGPVSRDDRMGSEHPSRDPTSPRTRLEGDLGNVLLLS